MKWPRECWAWRAIPNCGKPTKSLSRSPKNAVWVTPSAQRTWVRFSVKRESQLRIHFSAEKDPHVQAVVTVEVAWWAVALTPRIHFPKIICISQKNTALRYSQNQK